MEHDTDSPLDREASRQHPQVESEKSRGGHERSDEARIRRKTQRKTQDAVPIPYGKTALTSSGGRAKWGLSRVKRDSEVGPSHVAWKPQHTQTQGEEVSRFRVRRHEVQGSSFRPKRELRKVNRLTDEERNLVSSRRLDFRSNESIASAALSLPWQPRSQDPEQTRSSDSSQRPRRNVPLADAPAGPYSSPYRTRKKSAREMDEIKFRQERNRDSAALNAARYREGHTEVAARPLQPKALEAIQAVDPQSVYNIIAALGHESKKDDEAFFQAFNEDLQSVSLTLDALEDASTSDLYTYLLRAANRGCALLTSHILYLLVHIRGEEPSTYIYNAQILSQSHPSYGSAATAESIFNEMRSEGLTPDANTYHGLLRVLAVHPNCLLRSQILEEMREGWIDLSADGWHSIVASLIKEVHLEMALSTYEDMRTRNVPIQSWLPSALIYQCCDTGELDAALYLLQEQIRLGREGQLSYTLWQSALDAACEGLHYELVHLIWSRRVLNLRIVVSTGSLAAILHTAAREGDITMATTAFHMITERNDPFTDRLTEQLIMAYARAGDHQAPFTMLSVMESAGVSPDAGSTRPIRRTLLNMERPADAWKHFEKLRSEGRKIPIAAPHVILETVLEAGQNASEKGKDHENRVVDAGVDDDSDKSASQSPSQMEKALDTAFELYKTLHHFVKPTAETFDILLKGCRLARRKDLAVFLVSEMLYMKVQPTMLTYDRLILVCLEDLLDPSTGREDAFKYWKEMRSKQMMPRMGTVKKLCMDLAEARDPRAWRVWEEARDALGSGAGPMETRLEELLTTKHKK